MKIEGMSFFTPNNEIVARLEKLYGDKIQYLESLLRDEKVTFNKIGSLGLKIALFKEELDILISVDSEFFESVKNKIGNIAKEKHKEKLWDENYALFHSEEELPQTKYDKEKEVEHIVPIDYVVVVKDSVRDIHYKKTRKLLETNPKIQYAYSNLKMSYEGKPYEEYSKAKEAFWSELKDEIEAVEL